MDSQIKPEKNYKIVLLGGSSVGKTAFLRRYTHDQFIEIHQPTQGLDFSEKVVEVNGKYIKLQLWDASGSDNSMLMTSYNIHHSIGALLFYDVSSKQSLIDCQKWIKLVENHPNKNIIKMLVGTKLDLENSREVLFEQAQQLANEKGMHILETSAQNGNNVEQAIQMLLKAIQAKVDAAQQETNPQQ